MGSEQTNGPPPPAAPPQRLVSVDAYRGFVMLAMVSGGLGMQKLLHDPAWGRLADQFEHRAWEGCTFWDLIQPSFMFLVGVAMPFSFALRRARGEGWPRQFAHALRRAFTLVALGLFLDAFATDPPVVSVQFIRVLQQIAVGYLLAFLVLDRGPTAQALAAAGLLVAHTLAFVLFAGPSGLDPWQKGANVGVALDAWLHLPPTRGGYVTFNAISSTSTILFGVLCGELLRSAAPPARKLLVLAAAGAGGLLLGAALTPLVPMVKRLWTASFAVYAAGWTCLMLLGFYAVVDVLGFRRWTFPLVVVGVNSIGIYVAAGTLTSPIRRALRPFVDPFLRHLAPEWQPVALSVLVVLSLWLLCLWLYRHRIFFKV